MKTLLRNILVPLMLCLGAGCSSDENLTYAESFSSEVVISWIELQLTLSKETVGFSPPVTARAYGYIGLALYESVLGGMPNHVSMQGQISKFELGSIPVAEDGVVYHWGAVANASLATVTRSFYAGATPDNLAKIKSLEVEFENAFQATADGDVLARSTEYGKSVGEAVLIYADSDGQKLAATRNFPVDYVVPTGPGLWVPTSSARPIPLQPYWGEVRPFLEINVQGTLPEPPPEYSTDEDSAFHTEAMEVYEVVQSLTAEQKIIAEFWSDDPGNTATPPGHSFAILIQIFASENSSLEEAAEVYVRLGMAVHDAFISCWYTKYLYNLVRPISYIHAFIDDTWSIPLGTPPFPEYTSGHSVQSGAMAQILTDFYGDNYAFVDRTHESRTDIDGKGRQFSSFFDLAEEAAVSRLYGGIHFRSAVDLGVVQGKKVGLNIKTLRFER